MHWYNLVLLLGKPVEAKCTCCAAVTTAHAHCVQLGAGTPCLRCTSYGHQCSFVHRLVKTVSSVTNQ